jgi:hypothetical protein
VTAAAERMRRCRRRQRLGLDLLWIEADRWQLAEWLIEHGYLSDKEMDHPGKVEAAYSRATSEMTKPIKI